MTATVDALFSDPRVDDAMTALHQIRYQVKTGGGKTVWRQYPADPAVDEHLVRMLLAEFPTVDLVEVLNAWQTWLYDNPLSGKVNLRSRLRNWMKNGRRFDAERRDRRAANAGRGAGAAGRRYSGPSTAPARHDAYGESRELGDGDW